MSALIGWSGKESHSVAHVATAFDRIRDVSLHDWRRHNICDENGKSVLALTFPKNNKFILNQVVSRISDTPYSIRVQLKDNSNRLDDWVTIEGLIGGGDTVRSWVELLGLDAFTTNTLLAEITCADDANLWDAPAGTHEKVSAAIVGYITNYLQDNGISPKPGVTGDGLRFIDYVGDQSSECGSLERALYPLIHQPHYICSAFYDPKGGKTVLINSDTKPRDVPYFYLTDLGDSGIIYASRPEMMPYGIGELAQEPLPTGSLIIYPDHNNLILISDHE